MAKKNRSGDNPNIVKLWPTTMLVKRFAHYQKVNPALLKLFYEHRDRARPGSQAYASKDDLLSQYPLHDGLNELAEFISQGIGEVALDLLTEDHELALMRTLSRFPETIEGAARIRSPHLVAHYLHSLATELHSYYNAHQFLVDDENLRNARLNLVMATRIVLARGLDLLGVSAPEEM